MKYRLAIGTILMMTAVPIGGSAAIYGRRVFFERRAVLAPPLLSTFSASEAIFQSQLRQRFPAGSRAEDIASVLTAQGFTPSNTSLGRLVRNKPHVIRATYSSPTMDVGADHKMAIEDPRGFLCRLRWVVSWRANPKGMIDTSPTGNLEGYCL